MSLHLITNITPRPCIILHLGPSPLVHGRRDVMLCRDLADSSQPDEHPARPGWLRYRNLRHGGYPLQCRSGVEGAERGGSGHTGAASCGNAESAACGVYGHTRGGPAGGVGAAQGVDGEAGTCRGVGLFSLFLVIDPGCRGTGGHLTRTSETPWR